MRLLNTMLHPYSKHRFYIPRTFELRTYDAMLTTSIHHIEENDIEFMHHKMTSMRSICPHGGTQRNDTHHWIQHKCGPNWPILSLSYKTANLELRKLSSEYEEYPTVNQV